jgi:glutathione synthase/RimK-type ligase-like ATP-grasp enzyme
VHIAFVTSAAHSDLTPDDHLAVAELKKRGVSVSGAVWNDPAVDWGAFDAIILRSTWDYHHNADEFRTWIAAREAGGAPVWNPPAVLRWNMEKTYLRDLEDAGVPVVPTEWLAQGSRPDLRALLEARGWAEAVVKPVISAAATRTWRVSRESASEIEGQLAESLELGDVMVQPFIPEIQTRGEWSLMFFDGEFSHAVRKMPIDGDFRVQTGFGGRSAVEHPSEAVLSAVRKVLEAAPSPWLYVRVDGIETAAGYVLLELEMLEPSLFLAQNPEAPARFAEAIARVASR